MSAHFILGVDVCSNLPIFATDVQITFHSALLRLTSYHTLLACKTVRRCSWSLLTSTMFSIPSLLFIPFVSSLPLRQHFRFAFGQPLSVPNFTLSSDLFDTSDLFCHSYHQVSNSVSHRYKSTLAGCFHEICLTWVKE